MSRFRDIVRGARVREPVSFPVQGAETDATADLRVLLADEEIEAVSRARAFAMSKGLANPREGDAIYDLALMVETILLAALEVGSDARFFDAAEDVRALDRDTIQYVYQRHSIMSDRCSPRLLKMSPEEFVAGIAVLASEDSESVRFFERLGSGLQWIYTRTLARQAVISQTLRSDSGSTSAPTGTA